MQPEGAEGVIAQPHNGAWCPCCAGKNEACVHSPLGEAAEIMLLGNAEMTAIWRACRRKDLLTWGHASAHLLHGMQ